MASGSAVASALHNVLPEEALRVIMLALPVDARARAACVCRSWRAFLADTSLWQVLDLTPSGGVAVRVTENLVRGAVARAAGRLRVFSFNGVRQQNFHEFLAELVQSDGAELRQLNTSQWLADDVLGIVFAAAPHLQVLNANAVGNCTALLRFLRNDPPYGPLRVSGLIVSCGRGVSEGGLLALAAALAAHVSLTGLRLVDAHSARGLNAVVDAAAERQLSRLHIDRCVLDDESMHALARLLERGSLIQLHVTCASFPGAQEASMPVLCAALRACHTLTHPTLRLEDASRLAFTALLDAAAALPALSELDLRNSRVQDATAAGRAMGALLAANLPSLHTLNIFSCHLGDDGMAAVLDGLATNTYLHFLSCVVGNDLSQAFERDRLNPAMAALFTRRFRGA